MSQKLADDLSKPLAEVQPKLWHHRDLVVERYRLLSIFFPDRHPDGLANSSGQVGRNLMKHQNGAIIGVGKKPNPTVFQKTLAINDFYWGESGFYYPALLN